MTAIFPTLLQMATALKARLGLDGTPKEIVNRLTPAGELYMFHMLYLQYFGHEALPADVANPVDGALRFRDSAIEVWANGLWSKL